MLNERRGTKVKWCALPTNILDRDACEEDGDMARTPEVYAESLGYSTHFLAVRLQWLKMLCFKDLWDNIKS